jgi:small GTP-binding protein
MLKESELKLIKELEKEIGVELEEISLDKIGLRRSKDGWSIFGASGFAIDQNGNVIGLNLHDMELKSVPLKVLKFKYLKKLSFKDNRLEDISMIEKLTDLTSLTVLWNHASDISALQVLSQLTYLYLSANSLTDISVLQGLNQLTSLCLSYNSLTDISVLQGLSQLTSLDLSGNQLTDISVLQRLSQLTSLDLSYNSLTDISVLQGLSQLTSLGLRNNKISQLPETIVDLGMEIDVDKEYGGQGILLYGNPLESPPVEIIRKGKEAIRAYFKSLKKGELPLNEVKVLLVGDGGAGKTSLVKRLMGKEFDKKEPQTHGININRMQVKSGKVTINANLWDFGGQEIMHATHQFFLSKRSLYILVLDGRRDEKTEYWLKHIRSFGGDSPVLVVLNKIDENPGFELNRKYLMEKYGNIVGFFRISCAKDKGIKMFYRSMAKALRSVEMLRTTWANSWFKVKDRLEKMADNFIDYERYQEICEGAEITDESARETLVDFLNDLGVILHFREFHLEDTHILEPRWVTEAVYKIINSPVLADAKGILDLEQLKTILKQKKKNDFFYPRDKYRYIIELMKKFELCYEIDKKTVLVPDLLDVEESDFQFDYKNCLRFILEYDFLPRAVMPRFIVRMHQDIKEEGQCCRWRTGVVLENKKYKATAVIKADHEERKISIYVNGEQARDYLSVVRHSLGEINNSFEKLPVAEKIPLTDNEEVSLDYEELTGLEQMGVAEIPIGKLKKTGNVVQLLDKVVSPEERRQEYEKIAGRDEVGKDIYLSVNIPQHNILVQQANPVMKQETHVSVDIDIKVDLPAIQSDFDKLKELLESAGTELDAKSAKELEKIGDSLDDLTLESDKKELVKPFNRIKRFLDKLGDEDSKLNRALRGAKKGVQMAQKVGKTYNKFAQWLALPQVPKAFLGSDSESK